ncbi:hypothetical protein AZE42_13357 [Rhizopogon vesiculosus]|uniref:Uncharacterized protein n=1 Tax=Rhizopogon vesiculosus TaxID=180088 RepID=A0A1J8RBP6_9AGAM|nr:hypothetical protein AZE42_13357 [Rhizopogon vesiculosus]
MRSMLSARYKDRYLTGQGANTHARNAVSSIQAKIDAAHVRYNAARNAIINIAPHVNNIGWQVEFHLLDTNDVRSMSDLLDGETQGTKSISWIWKMRGAATSEEDCEGSLEAMHIEWCKAHACTMRWAEEVELLKEEMQRILQYLEWEAVLWDKHAVEFHSSDDTEYEGCIAYAKWQADLHRSLALQFTHQWKDTCAWMDSVDTEDEL